MKAITATDGATAFWVGQGDAKPLTTMVYTGLTLPRLKAMGLTVVTRELLESSAPEAESVIRVELLRAVVNALDSAFIDPDNDGVDDVYPAAVTAGLVPISGTADPTADLKALLGAFGGDLASAFLVMPPELAVGIAGPAYPRIGARGGEMAGIPAVTSRNVPAGVMALVDPAGIALAEGEGEVRTLAHGDVLMADDPTMASAEVGSPPSGPTAATLVNLWQVGAVAILAGRWINWATVRPGSVALLTGAAYGDAEGLP